MKLPRRNEAGRQAVEAVKATAKEIDVGDVDVDVVRS